MSSRARRRSSHMLITALGAVGLAACGNSATTCGSGSSCAGSPQAAAGSPAARSSGAPVPVAAATPTPPAAATPVIVWEARDGSVSYFLDLAGKELGRFVHPPTAAGVAPLATGESSTRFFTVSGNMLSFYGRHGTRVDSQPFVGGENFFGPVFAPGDVRWLWTAGGLNGGTAHTTRLLLGGAGKAVRQLTQHPDPDARQLTPIAHARNLFYLSEQVTNGGEQLVFPSTESAWTADPASGAVRRVAGPDCHLQDVASDGRLLCLDTQQQLLTVRSSSGVLGILRFPGGWEQAGAGAFSPDGSRVVVSTASPGQQRRSAYVGSATGGAMSPLEGAYAAFLADGRILALHEQGGYDLITASGARIPVEVSGPAHAGAFAGLIQHPRD